MPAPANYVKVFGDDFLTSNLDTTKWWTRLIESSGVLTICLLAGSGCGGGPITPAQVQSDQAIAQAVLNTACSTGAEQLVATAIPEVGLFCVGGKLASAVVTAAVNNPVIVAKIVAIANKVAH